MQDLPFEITNSGALPHEFIIGTLKYGCHLPRHHAWRPNPVCGIEVDEAIAKHTAEYDGQTYYFGSPCCKKAFEAEPQTYLDPNYKSRPPARSPADTFGGPHMQREFSPRSASMEAAE